MCADRAYTPDVAPVQALRSHIERLGFDRAVIIQPSFYGRDNRCLLDALEQMQGLARGVAVLGDDVNDLVLEQLTAAGVVGLRLNLESIGCRDPDELVARLKKWSVRLAPYGWHIQVYASFEPILAVLDGLESLDVPLVLDHFAMAPAGLSPEDARLARLLQGLRSGRLYIKLSGSYRLEDANKTQVCSLAQQLIQANPDRVLWASDWPHTNREPDKAATMVSAYRKIDAGSMLSDLHAWVGDDMLLHKLLVDNPAALYRF